MDPRHPRIVVMRELDWADGDVRAQTPLPRLLQRARPPAAAERIARPAALGRLDALYHRRHAAAAPLLRRAGHAAGAAGDDGPEVLPHARHRPGRPHRTPPDLLRDAGQL